MRGCAHPAPTSVPEARRRRSSLLLSLGAAAVQGVLLLSHPGPPSSALLPAAGLVITLGLALLSRWSRLAWSLFAHLVLGLSTLWVLGGLALHVQTGAPSLETQMLSGLSLGVLAYAWLPLWPATAWTLAGLLPTLALALLRSGDPAPALHSALALLIIAVTSQSGQRLVRERERAEWLQDLAFRDPLTGLHNRRLPLEELERLMARRPVPEDVAVVLFDLDHFKRINDTFGHLRGDDVLTYIAALLTRQLPQDTLLCRWGGEEFLAVLYGQSREQAQRQVAGVLAGVQRIQIRGMDRLTLSAGGAMLGEAQDVRGVLGLADRRLYAAKDAGRNRAAWGQETRPVPQPGP